MKNPFSGLMGSIHRTSRQVSLQDVQSIMKPDNVIVESSSKKILGVRKLLGCPMPYRREVYEFCAEHNSLGEAWTLFAKLGVSPVKLRRKFPAEFSNSSVWAKKYKWLEMTSKPSYLLVNLKPQFAGVTEVERVASFSSQRIIARAHLSTVIEFSIVYKLLRGQAILEDKFHCADPVGEHIPIAGIHDSLGILVTTLPCGIIDRHCLEQLGVIVCVTPEKELSLT